MAAENIYESAGVYQCPSHDEKGLYEQINSYHIITISRKDIKLVTDESLPPMCACACITLYSFISHLGSGQFGSVSKAEWRNNHKQTTVAVKTLTDSANTVKFLQEAAIMAQFRHPNILTLHGVVSTGDPVSIHLLHCTVTITLFNMLTLCPENDSCGAYG